MRDARRYLRKRIHSRDTGSAAMLVQIFLYACVTGADADMHVSPGKLKKADEPSEKVTSRPVARSMYLRKTQVADPPM
jgi:hypothetical protein